MKSEFCLRKENIKDFIKHEIITYLQRIMITAGLFQSPLIISLFVDA